MVQAKVYNIKRGILGTRLPEIIMEPWYKPPFQKNGTRRVYLYKNNNSRLESSRKHALK